MQISSNQTAEKTLRYHQTILVSFLLFTAFGLLNFGSNLLNDLAQGRQHTWARQLFNEMTAIYIVCAIFPIVSQLVRIGWLRRSGRLGALLLGCSVIGIVSLLDTTALWIVRRLLSPIFGLGPYDYGNLGYRYPMELAKHVPIYVVLMSGVYAFDTYQQFRDRQLKSAELEASLAEAQLKALRLQLEPHFLFNTLNTISSVMHEDVNRADEMLIQLSDLLRHTLKLTSAQKVSLAEELQLLEKYVAVMKGRMGDDLEVSFRCGADTRAALVPPLILQPLVENAIRHGRMSSSSKLIVNVASELKDGYVCLTVHDNGPGFEHFTDYSSHQGIGLTNTQGRLERLYGMKQTLLLEDIGGLKVTITIPLSLGATND